MLLVLISIFCWRGFKLDLLSLMERARMLSTESSLRLTVFSRVRTAVAIIFRTADNDSPSAFLAAAAALLCEGVGLPRIAVSTNALLAGDESSEIDISLTSFGRFVGGAGAEAETAFGTTTLARGGGTSVIDGWSACCSISVCCICYVRQIYFLEKLYVFETENLKRQNAY
jgi:hypothetical protein